MNDTHAATPGPNEMSRDELMSAIFAQMVIQQANMAMMLLGRRPNPQTGKAEQDIEGAKMFIDQLEMLEVKTKGNLSKEEQNLLKQSLMSLRLAFVEAVESPDRARPEPPQSASAEPAPSQPQASPAAPSGIGAPPESDSRKKFSKKY